MKKQLEIGVEQDIGASTRRRVLKDACQAHTLRTAGGLELNVAVVADGFGGENADDHAARLTVSTILEHCRRSTGSNIPHMLREGIERANAAVYAEGRSEPARRGLGSTATVIAIHKQRLYLAHVGHSRAYLVRGQQVRQLTQDHTWASEVVRAGKLSSADAEKNPRAEKLVRFVGYGPRIEVDQAATGNQGLVLKPGDSVVVCSDGLIKNKANGRGHYVEAEEIAQSVENNSAFKAARTLLSLALQRNVDDNVSVIVMKLPDSQVMELVKGFRQNVLAVGGVGVLLTASVLMFGFFAFGQSVFGGNKATPTPRPLPPNAAYIQFIRGEGRVTYITNRMTRPENLAQDTFVNSGIGSLIKTEGQAAVKLFLTQTLVVWLGPGSELEIRELASTQTGSSHTEVKLLNGIMLTLVTAELQASETYQVIGDPGHLAQVTGSVMGVRYDKDDQTFDVDCLEGHCVIEGERLADCEGAHSESDLIPGPIHFADQARYAFVEKDEKLTAHCVPTATPPSAPSPTRTYPPKPTVTVPPTEPPPTSTPAVNVTAPPPNPPQPGQTTPPLNTPVPPPSTIVVLPSLTPAPTFTLVTTSIPTSPVPSDTPLTPSDTPTLALPFNTPTSPPPIPTKCKPKWKCK